MEGMARVSRIRFTPRQKVELWERWKSGQCVADIARALERRNKSGVYRLLALTGGIAPPPRRRAPLALSLEEREEISRGIAAGRSMRQIAVGLGRCPSTVSRELGRNGGRATYRASEADQSAWERAGRPKLCRLATHPELRWRVAGKLALQWSPQQISAWLRREYAGEEELQISHETIYRSLFVQARGVLKKELMVHLRTRRQLRQVKGGTTKIGLGSIVDAISIRERPAEVEDRAVPLGRRPPVRGEEHAYCDARRTPYAFRDADQARRQGHHLGRRGTCAPSAQAPQRAAPLVNLGPRHGDGRAQAFHTRDRRAGLLLRSAQSLAARQQREHQRAAAPVLPEGDGSLRLLAGVSQPDRATAQPATKEDLGL